MKTLLRVAVGVLLLVTGRVEADLNFSFENEGLCYINVTATYTATFYTNGVSYPAYTSFYGSGGGTHWLGDNATAGGFSIGNTPTLSAVVNWSVTLNTGCSGQSSSSWNGSTTIHNGDAPFIVDVSGPPCQTNYTAYFTNFWSGYIDYFFTNQQGAYVGSYRYQGPLNPGSQAFGNVLCGSVPYAFGYSNEAVACTTNITVVLNDTWTNNIWVTVKDVHNVQQYSGEIAGPLNSYPLAFSSVQCTNLPYVASYSNEPPCMAALVFNEINQSQFWRIFAVVNTASAGGVGGALGEGLVPPGGQYYYSNSVPCGQQANYYLYASHGNGDDSVENTGINGSNSTTNSPSNQIGNSTSPPGGTNTNNVPNYADLGQAPPVTNTPPLAVNPVTNSLPPVSQPTNALLAVVPQVTNGLAIVPASTNGIIWQNTNTDLTALTTAVQNSGQAIYSAANTAAGQAHSDAANIANTLATGVNQAHSDANGVNNSVVNGNAQAATNAAAINNTLQNGLNQLATNLLAGQAQGVANANGIIFGMNSNSAAVLGGIGVSAGAVSAAAAVQALAWSNAVSGLANSTSSGLTNIANQDSVSLSNAIASGVNQAASLSNAVSTAASSSAGVVSNAVAAAASGSTTIISNLLTQIVSNTVAGETNYALETTQDKVLSTDVGISNILRGMSNSLSISNTVGSYGLDSTMTNASSALGWAVSLEDLSGVNGWISDMTPSLPSDTATPVAMTLSFCGTTVDFDPVHMFPGVAAMCYTGFKVVALLLFFLEVGRLYWQAVQTRATAQTGRVPDLEVFGGATGEFLGIGGGASAGGNFLGVIVYGIVTVAFIAVWAGAMSYVFSAVGYSVSDAMNVAGWTSQINSLALYLLCSFIPVRTLFDLLCTRIVLQFTLARLVGLASLATRRLMG